MKAITDSVVPAHQELLKFVQTEYWPKTRKTLAAEAMPDGAAFYQQQIHEYTTLDLTADQIHQIGLDEVNRIHAEMLDAMKATGFTGTFPEFLTYPAHRSEVLRQDTARAAGRRGADRQARRREAVAAFRLSARPLSCFTIIPVPDNIAPFYTSAAAARTSIWSTPMICRTGPCFS